jgi:hypothetical protein
MNSVAKVPPASWTLGQRWIWILDIIWGAIVGIAFERLDGALRSCTNLGDIIKHVAVAACLFIFFLYDVGVHHLLVRTFPYRESILSACRYFLDIVMAFLLMLLLVSGLTAKPERSTIVILVAITSWHLGASAWHFLATWEHEHKLPTRVRVLPHLISVGGYWLLVGIWYLIRLSTSSVNWHAQSLLFIVCGAIFLVALVRSYQVVRHIAAKE